MATPKKHPDDLLPLGRPTSYTPELAQRILDVIATTDKGLDEICDDYPDFPVPSTIYQWRIRDLDFSKKYMEAKSNQAQIYAESTLKIAQMKVTFTDAEGNEKVDPGHVAWQKLNVNTRQWHASKLAPKVYGDKREIEQLQGENERVKAELAALRDKLDKANVSEY